jgi:ABC-2 type transport system ATP-binding protein
MMRKQLLNAIQIETLSKTYQGGVQALNNVSFNVQEGQIFGLLGPNGSGKTTLVKSLLSIINISSGSAKIFDENINHSKIRRRLGYLPENHKYPLFLTGYDVLFYYGGLSNIPRVKLKEKIPELLKIVSMDEWANVKIKKYSKGMMQRIGLAQALVSDPDLIFLDEPTDGIDPVGRREIHDILKKLKNEGKTIFLNSHMLAEVESVCDEVAILKKGRLLRIGTVEELTTQKEHYTFVVEPLSEGIQNQLQNDIQEIIFETDSKLLIAISNYDELNRTIDTMRSKQILIKSIQNVKSSLEDSFIEIVNKEDQ